MNLRSDERWHVRILARLLRRLRRREIFGWFGKKREVTAATDSFFFSSLSSFFSTINAEWSSTYCRPSRRDINVVVTIGLLLQNGWLQKALRARDHFEREKRFDFVLISHRVVLLYCRDDNSVNPARFEPRLWRRLVPNLHDFYDWAIYDFMMRLRRRLVVALFGRSRWHFTQPFSSSVLLSSTTEQSEQVHI